MSSPSTTRVAGLAGIAFVVLLLVAFVGLTPSDGLPDSGDTAEDVGAYIREHRNTLLASNAVATLGALAMILFSAAVIVAARRAGADTLWVVVAAFGVIGSGGCFLAGIALFEAAAFRPAADPGIQQALRDAGFMAFNASGIGITAFIGAISLSVRPIGWLAGWMAPVGLLIAALHAVAAVALKGDGAMSPEGAVPIAAAVALLVWVLAVSVMALRAGAQDEAAA
jgi:hypothetical protein